jgi:hypothetical protein
MYFSNYCPNCGAHGSGNFCSKCGTPLNDAITVSSSEAVQDWSREVEYHKLIRIQQVRNIILRHAGIAKRAYGEIREVLSLFHIHINKDPLSGSWHSWSEFISATIVMGSRDGGVFQQNLSIPPGIVIVSVLCSLVRHHQLVEKVEQGKDGCGFEVIIPWERWWLPSLDGKLFMGVSKSRTGSLITAASLQSLDLGKIKRCWERLIREVEATSAEIRKELSSQKR